MIKRLCIFAAGAAAVVSAALATSCEKDETQEKYVYILDNDKNGIQEVSFNTAGGTQDFLMYSNYGSWKLVPTYEEDLEWLSYWPTEGVGDARFSAMVEKNTTAYQRHGTLNIVVDGLSVATIRFNQAGDEPKLKVNVKESGKTVSVKGETFTVGVESNIDWVAELVDPADASWVTIGDFTPVSQTFTCAANPGSEPREAQVRIRAYGTSVSCVFAIMQADRSSAFEEAEKITVADLLAMGEGKIARNVYVVGSVISDRTTRNYPVAYSTGGGEQVNNTMFIQDETGGLWIEFDDAADNTWRPEPGRDAPHVRTAYRTRRLYQRIEDRRLSSTAVQSAVAGTPVEPVVIDNLTKLPAYENRLVTLRNVEFALPYGTLVNINEGVSYLGIKTGSRLSGFGGLQRPDDRVRPLPARRQGQYG